MSQAATLKRLSRSWKAQATRAKAEGFGPQRVDDGRYIGRLSDALLEEGSNGLRMKMVFTILEAPDEKFVGKFLTKSDGLEGEDSQFYTARTLGMLGYDPEEIDLSQLPAILKDLAKEKPVCRLQAKTNDKDYQSVYINGVIEDYEDDDSGDEEDDEESGEIEEGSEVTWSGRGGKLVAGTVVSINAKTDKATVEDENGKKLVKDLDTLTLADSDEDEDEEDEDEDSEEEDEEDEDDEAPLSAKVGMRVIFTLKGKEEEGEIKALLPGGKAKVAKDSGGVATMEVAKLEVLEDEETDEEDEEDEEDEPAPKARGRASSASKASTPAKKTTPATKTTTPTRGAKAAATPVKKAAPEKAATPARRTRSTK